MKTTQWRNKMKGDRTVYVVAWQYQGGAGFDFYYKEADADAAYLEEIKNTEDPQLKLEGWSAYRFDVNVPPDYDKDQIVSDIDEDLDNLCWYADTKVENVLPEYGKKLSELPRPDGNPA